MRPLGWGQSHRFTSYKSQRNVASIRVISSLSNDSRVQTFRVQVPFPSKGIHTFFLKRVLPLLLRKHSLIQPSPRAASYMNVQKIEQAPSTYVFLREQEGLG